MLNVLRMHRDARRPRSTRSSCRPSCSAPPSESWDDAVRARRASTACATRRPSVLAPTGTIGLMMDCDTTGIEPDLGLVKMKKLVGGGTMFIVNQTIPRALRQLGYTPTQIDEIVAYIDEHKTILGAPHLDRRAPAGVRLLDGRQHDPLHGSRADDGRGAAVHLAAPSPRPSTCPRRPRSKTSRSCTSTSWQLGLKAVAIYRDNCKVGQPLSTRRRTARASTRRRRRPPTQTVERIVETSSCTSRSARSCRAPARRSTFEFRVADCHGFATVGEYDDGRPGELFLKVVQAGLDARRHHGRLRHLGQPRPAVRRAAAGVRRDVHQHALRARGHDRRPRHPLRHSSLVDYIFRRLAVEYLSLRRARRARHPHGRASACSRRCPASRRRVIETSHGHEIAADPKIDPVGRRAGRRRSSSALDGARHRPSTNPGAARPRRPADARRATRRCACSAACR